MDTIVIDGYNVIYAIPDLRRKILKKGPKSAREAFIDLCARYKKSRKDISHIYIVFDGKEQDSGMQQKDMQGVNIIFSHGKKEADDIIIELIKDNEPARHFIVVSSDNYVRNNSQIYSARLMSPTAFRRELEKRVMLTDKPAEKASNDIKSYKSEVTDWYKGELEDRGILDLDKEFE